MTDPNDPFEHWRAIEWQLQQFREVETARRRQEEFARTLMPSVAIARQWQSRLDLFESTRQMFDALVRQEDHTREFQEFAKSWLSEKRLIEESARGEVLKDLARRIATEQHDWSHLHQQISLHSGAFHDVAHTLAAFSSMRSTWEASLDTVGAALGARARVAEATFLPRLLAPFQDFSEFARHTLSRVAADRGEDDTIASAALALAEREVTHAAVLLTAVASSVSGDVEDEPDAPSSGMIRLSPPSASALFAIQNEEIRTHGPILVLTDTAALVALSPSAARADRQRQLGQLILACNEAAEYAGIEMVFRPTNTLLRCIGDLGWIRPEDRDGFSSFIDCLYLILYEGAGKDTLRYTGLVDEDDLAIIWVVKHLRNKLLRHDPDHGSAGSIRKSWRDLATTMGFLDLRWLPVTRDEHRTLHDHIATAVIAFSERLLARIRSKGPGGHR